MSEQFCLESKIRHAIIESRVFAGKVCFALNPKSGTL